VITGSRKLNANLGFSVQPGRGSRLFSFHLARKMMFIDGGQQQRHLQKS